MITICPYNRCLYLCTLPLSASCMKAPCLGSSPAPVAALPAAAVAAAAAAAAVGTPQRSVRGRCTAVAVVRPIGPRQLTLHPDRKI